MISKSEIEEGAVRLLRVIMGVTRKEKVLVVTDLPKPEEWKNQCFDKLSKFIKRTLLAKALCEVASERFPDCQIEFFTYPSLERAGAEPNREVAQKLTEVDVVIAITTYSLTHTKARKEATEAGVRFASMPWATAYTFSPDGPLNADYNRIKEETERMAKILTEAEEATITTKLGTDISFKLKGRSATIDAGILKQSGAVGNLPAGEAFLAPIEGFSEGKVIVEKGWHPDLKENMTLIFTNGEVTKIIGGGSVGVELENLLKIGLNEQPYTSRRKLAELGIGTNPNAKRIDNPIEAEKIRGTAHIAIGTNYYFGGTIRSDLHKDFIITKPTLRIDNKIIMRQGEILI